ncbi:MAG: type II toxin-antitoxin system HicA family toxin [Oscillospiraceae bacterium]|nr:type II toxin-antitoxin system HicA family toxin [Oscillospiraceae bacterium]
MKRRDLVKRLTALGYYSVRNDGSHEIFSNGKQAIPIPRHREINEITAKEILKRAELTNIKSRKEV